MVKKPRREWLAETFLTGAVVNMVLGGIGAVVIQFLLSIPSLYKTILWWVGGATVAVVLGYLIQKYFSKEKPKPAVVIGGLGVGVFIFILTSSLATLFFPWARTSADTALQGPGVVLNPLVTVLLPALLAAAACLLIAIAVFLRRK